MNSHPSTHEPQQSTVSTRGLLILSHQDVADLLDLETCIAAVEDAFRMQGNGHALPQGLLHVDTDGGGFHIKTGGLISSRTYFGLKSNGRFPDNRKVHGLPNVQGIIYLVDGDTGTPLAIMDSVHITGLRTGAATAVAATFLAPSGPVIVTVCGCGTQARVQLAALSKVKTITEVYAYCRSSEHMRTFSENMSRDLDLSVTPAPELAQATRKSNIILTCTPSRQFFLRAGDVLPGTFIAAIGSDNANKQEIDPQLLANSKVVVDSIDQAARIGELHHALEEGLMDRGDVYAELGEVVTGRMLGRSLQDETIIFDATGMAFQDVAAATAVYIKAMNASRGVYVRMQER